MILSALNIPLKIGDLVAVPASVNGYLEVTKGIVTGLDTVYLRVTILGVKGDRYLNGKPMTRVFPQQIRKVSRFGRLLVQVSDKFANEDPDFDFLFRSKRFKDLKI